LCEKPISVEECIVWARLRFEENFHNSIAQLLHNFPLDMTTSSGAPFWSGPNRPPQPLAFDKDSEQHIDFILAAANLRAVNYGLKGTSDRAFVKKVADSVMVPEFVPRSGVKIVSDPKEEEKEKEKGGPPADTLQDEENVCAEITKQLPTPSSMAGYRMTPAEFEKDDDTNFHIDFITATSNLRAANYKIAEADRHKTKGIAGKIIPAIATTTAMVTGLVSLELLKLVQLETKKIEDFKNAFCNLALPFVSFSEPIVAPTKTVGDGKMTWSLWDRFDIDEGRDITLKEFIAYFNDKHGLEVTMISSGVSILYSFFTNAKKLKERMPMPMSQLVTEVSKTEYKPKQRYITFEICANDVKDDEDVEVPYVRYKFRGF